MTIWKVRINEWVITCFVHYRIQEALAFRAYCKRRSERKENSAQVFDAEQKLSVERTLALPQSVASINDARKSARIVVMVYKKQAESITASALKVPDKIRVDSVYDGIWVRERKKGKLAEPFFSPPPFFFFFFLSHHTCGPCLEYPSHVHSDLRLDLSRTSSWPRKRKLCLRYVINVCLFLLRARRIFSRSITEIFPRRRRRKPSLLLLQLLSAR